MSKSKSSTTIAILDENLHSIACKSCRHLHLYCDKRLPTCSECAQRGRACCYEKPKKRGRPVRNSKSSSSSSEQSHSDGSSTSHSSGDSSSSSNGSANTDCSNVEKNSSRKIFKFQLSDEKNTEMKRYHPYNILDIVNKCKYTKGRNLSVGIDDELIRNNCKLETIDFFYKVVDPGFDLISVMEMKHLLIEMNESSRENVGFISMMYSIQALCEQRLANPQRSEMAAAECRKYLTRSDYNIYTKISYAVLSDYFGGEGQDDVAMSYLNHLNRILGDVPKSFEYLIIRADRTCKIVDREWLGAISSIVFIYSIYHPPDKSHDFDLKSIEEGINAQNAEVAISFVQQVNNIMVSIFNNHSKEKYSEDYAAMKHILHEFVFISGISSIFFSLGLEGEIVDSLVDRADKLMEDFNVQLSSVSVFPHLSVFMSYRVKKFGYILAEFQFHIMNGMDIRSIFCLEKFQKYFNGIVLYLKTMNEFSKRYKRISKYFCQLYQNLLAIAKWKFDVQAQIIPNAILEEDRVEKDSESELPSVNSIKSPIADIPIPLLTPMLSSGKESTFLSCLEKAKLNQAFSI